jgi:hypothetical protein
VSRSEPSPKRLTRLQLRLRGEADEVENPKEATSVSREIGCAPSVEEPWGPDVPDQHAIWSAKGERGRTPVMRRPDRRARRLAGAKPKEAPTWTPG